MCAHSLCPMSGKDVHFLSVQCFICEGNICDVHLRSVLLFCKNQPQYKEDEIIQCSFDRERE